MVKIFQDINYKMRTEIFLKRIPRQNWWANKEYAGTDVLMVVDRGEFIKFSGLFERVTNSLGGR